MSGEQASDAQGYRYVVREVPASGELDGGTAVARTKGLCFIVVKNTEPAWMGTR